MKGSYVKIIMSISRPDKTRKAPGKIHHSWKFFVTSILNADRISYIEVNFHGKRELSLYMNYIIIPKFSYRFGTRFDDLKTRINSQPDLGLLNSIVALLSKYEFKTLLFSHISFISFLDGADCSLFGSKKLVPIEKPR
mmetsp:Transcript_43144/g.84757  ORF Transcript_43144/g.84757 Transcript_43144/m.84757 type:complete len:138 (-) Transcript_43144:328-741(-)